MPFLACIITISIICVLISACGVGMFWNRKLDSWAAANRPNIDIVDPGTGGGGGSSSDWYHYMVDNEPVSTTPPEDYQSLMGQGTASSPYLIYGQTTFQEYLYKSEISSTTVYGSIMNDFRFFATEVEDLSNTFVQNASSYGSISLDGNYHRISLGINVTVGRDFPRAIGLIGSIGSAYISDLKVTGNVNVSGESIECVGGVIGCCFNATFDNCYVATSIDVNASANSERSAYIGGLVGMTTSINSGSGYGYLGLENTVFCGEIDYEGKVNKSHPYATTGSSSSSQSVSNTNSYYHYQKNGVISQSTNYFPSSFSDAYSAYKSNSSEKKWVMAEPFSIALHYYCAAPNVAWLVNRSLTPVALKYQVKQGSQVLEGPVHLAWTADLGTVTIESTSVTFVDLGVTYAVNYSYTKPEGYDLKSTSRLTSNGVCLLTIVLDCKITIQIMDPVISGTGDSLATSEYTITKTGTFEPVYSDQLSFTYDAGASRLVLTSGSNTQTIVASFKTSLSDYVWKTWKVGSYTGANLGSGGAFGTYSGYLVFESGCYVLKVYPIVAEKEYHLGLI